MGRQRRINQRCNGYCKDGSRCGRYCADGETLCAKHNGSPATGVIAAQETDDPGALLRRLMKDRDPAIRLRAIEAWQKYEERRSGSCAACAARTKADRALDRFRQGLTRSERLTLVDLLQEMKNFKASVYERDPDLRPEDEPTPVAIAPPAPAPAPTSAPVAVAAPDDDDPAPVAEPEPVEAEEPVAGPVELPREDYHAAGLIVLKDGSVTHSLGDAHARRIISGEIPFETAAAQHAAALEQGRLIEHSQEKRR